MVNQALHSLYHQRRDKSSLQQFKPIDNSHYFFGLRERYSVSLISSLRIIHRISKLWIKWRWNGESHQKHHFHWDYRCCLRSRSPSALSLLPLDWPNTIPIRIIVAEGLGRHPALSLLPPPICRYGIIVIAIACAIPFPLGLSFASSEVWVISSIIVMHQHYRRHQHYRCWPQPLPVAIIAAALANDHHYRQAYVAVDEGHQSGFMSSSSSCSGTIAPKLIDSLFSTSSLQGGYCVHAVQNCCSGSARLINRRM